MRKNISAILVIVVTIIFSLVFFSNTRATASPVVTFTSQTGSYGGGTINVPLVGSGFTTSTGSADLNISYNTSLLTYTGYTSGSLPIGNDSSFSVGESVSGTITLGWAANPSGAFLNLSSTTTIVTLHFTAATSTYTTANLSFEGTNEFMDSAANPLADPPTFVTGTITLNPPLTAPSNVATTTIGTSSIGISWTDNNTSPNETSFRIVQTDNGTDWTTVTTTAADVTSYTITGLTPNQGYAFGVIAVGSVGNDSATGTTGIDPIFPDPVIPVSVSFTYVSTSSLAVQWESNGNTGDTDYEVYYNGSSTSTIGMTSTTLIDLTPGTSYDVKVRAQYKSNTSTYTAYSATSTTSTTQVPTAPVFSVSALSFSTNGSGLVTVTGTVSDANGDNAILYVNYSLDGGSTWASSTIHSTSVGTSLTTGTISGITGTSGAGTSIVFTWDSLTDAGAIASTTVKLRGTVADAGLTGNTVTSSNFTIDNAPPSAPTGIIFTPTASSVTFSWSSATDDSAIALYTVSTTAGSATSTAATTTVYSGLSPNTRYYFQVKATDAYGNVGNYSTSTSSVTFANTPGTPTVNTPTTSSLAITIDTNSNPVSTTYAIYNITDNKYLDSLGAATTTPLFRPSSTWSGISATGLSANTQYSFQVVAKNILAINSATSSAGTAYTAANIPNAISAVTSTLATNLIITYGADNGATTYAVYDTVAGKYLQANATWSTTSAWIAYASLPTSTTGLTANSQHTLEVQGKNGDGVTTTFGSTISGYTLAATPAAPTVSAVSASSLSVAIASDDNPAGTKYAVQVDGGDYLQTDGSTTSTAQWDSVDAWGTVTVAGFSTNTQHAFQVIARNEEHTPTTMGTAATKYTLAAVASAPTVGTPTTSTIPLTINVNGNPASTTYAIYNYTDGNYLTSAGAVTSTAVYFATTTWNGGSATDLTPNKSYQFKVVSKNGDNVTTTMSSASEAATTDAVAPAQPTGSPNGQTSVKVTWTGDNNNSGTVYELVNTTNSSTVGTTTNTSYIVTSLTAATSYQFKIRAQYLSNSTTWTDYSETSTATTTASVGSSVTIELNNGTSSTFQLTGGTSHTVTLDSISNGTATLSFASTPFSVSLSNGQSSNNADNGLTITMGTVGSNSAQFTITTYTAPSSGGGGGVPAPQPPIVSSFTINNGAKETNSRVVTLNSFASNVNLMVVSNEAYFDSSSYEPYQANKAWTLTPGNGKKTVYVMFRSSQGGTVVASYSINLVGQAVTAEVISAGPYVFTKDLAYGANNTEVKQLQLRLQELGFLAKTIKIVNNFGSATKAAVIKLQTTNKLKADGKVNSAVRDILNGTVTQPIVSTTPTAPLASTDYKFNTNLSYGMRSEIVKQLQIKLQALGYLTVTPNGVFGPATKAAVVKFQKDHDLKPYPGNVGSATRAVLNQP